MVKINKIKGGMFVLALILLTACLIIVQGCSEGDNMANSNSTADKKEIAVFETSMGNFEIELNREKAPITVENFVTYVNEGHYEGTVFHRVIGNFMIQGGGFTPDGKQKRTHEPIKLESNNSLSNTVGTVAMARTMVRDSATNQFFVNVENNYFLDYTPKNDGYAVFGKVVSGIDTVNKIKAVKTGSSPMPDWPVQNVIINKAYMKTN